MPTSVHPAPIRPKVSAPDAAGALIRADQLDAVATGAAAPLLLVHASAGYGKTTLVANASRRLGWNRLWYRLDELDRRPSLLVRTLAQALATNIPGFGDALAWRLATAHTVLPVDEAVSLLAEELTARLDGDLHIILDECEQLSGLPKAAGTIRLLQAAMPSSVHLVLITREEPALSLARLRLRGEVSEIHEDVLRFDFAQTRELADHRSQSRLADDEVATLLRLTDGWPAGIELAIKALAWRDFASLADALSRPRALAEVFAFLAEEVFERQTAEVRELLLRTCSVDSLTEGLAHELTQRNDAELLLSYLVANRTFTFADADGLSFRYHPLFREFLLGRLHTELGPRGVHALRLASALALERTGDYERAVGLLLELREPTLVLQLFARQGTQSIDDCSSRCLEEVLAKLPKKDARSRAWARFLTSQLYDRRGERPRATAAAQQALRSFAQAEDDRGQFLALRTLQLEAFHADNHSSAIEYAQQGLALAPSAFERCRLLSMEAQSWLFLGELGELRRVLAESDGVAAEAGPEAVARHSGTCALVAFASGNVRAALHQGKEALKLIRATASATNLVGFIDLLADMHMQAAEYETAELLAEEGRTLAHQNGLPFLGAGHLEIIGRVRIASGRADEGMRILEDVLASPAVAADPHAIAETHTHLGSALRRAGELARAERHLVSAFEAVAGTENRLNRIAAQANLAFTQGLLHPNSSDAAVRELHDLRDLSRRLGFRMHAGQCEFFAAALLVRSHRGGGPASRGLKGLVACVSRLLDLGLLHFPCQEFCHDPRLFGTLIRASLPTPLLANLLDAVARGPEAQASKLLNDAMLCGEEAALAALDAAGRHLPETELDRVLARAPRRRWVTVRRRAEQIRRDRGLSQDDDQLLFPELTARERQILALLASGRRNKEMAGELSLSPATVYTHVHRVLARLGVSSRVEATLLYRERTSQG